MPLIWLIFIFNLDKVATSFIGLSSILLTLSFTQPKFIDIFDG